MTEAAGQCNRNVHETDVSVDTKSFDPDTSTYLYQTPQTSGDNNGVFCERQAVPIVAGARYRRTYTGWLKQRRYVGLVEEVSLQDWARR